MVPHGFAPGASPLVFAASPLCALAFKLLKLPNYAGYNTTSNSILSNPNRGDIQYYLIISLEVQFSRFESVSCSSSAHFFPPSAM